MQSLKKQIENILLSNEYARNYRKHLYRLVCLEEAEKQGIKPEKMMIFFEVLHKMPRESAVVRESARLQNKPWSLVAPNEKVKKARQVKEFKCRVEYKESLVKRLFNKIF